jgi:putative membrane protein
MIRFDAMASMLGDPRVFFAAERTLLAWVRTGLTIMAFGFVVRALRTVPALLATQQGQGLPEAELHNRLSNAVGIALVLIGVACMILGARPAQELRRHASAGGHPALARADLPDHAVRRAGDSGNCPGDLPRDLTVCALQRTVRKVSPHGVPQRV